MFNVQVLNKAISELSSESKAEIQKMVDIFDAYQTEVKTLSEQAEAFEQLAITLQRDKENLITTITSQAEKIKELTAPSSIIQPKEEFLNSHEI